MRKVTEFRDARDIGGSLPAAEEIFVAGERCLHMYEDRCRRCKPTGTME